MAIRPNGLSVHKDRPAGLAVPGRVTKAVYLGKNWELTVESPLGETLVTPFEDRGLAAVGGELWLGIEPSVVTPIPGS